MGHKSHPSLPWWTTLLRTCVVLIVGGASSIAVAAQATLEWDPNAEHDIAGYRVHYGTSSGSYDHVIDVGNTSSATVSNLTPGVAYYFVVTAYNTSEQESLPSNEAFTEVQNKVPTVILVEAPGDGSYEEGTSITFNVSATDVDGSIAKVEFYEGNNKIGEDTSAPYSLDWVLPGPGRFQISARATDNDGATASSNVISVTGKGPAIHLGKARYTGLIMPPESSPWYSGAFTVQTTASGAFTGNLVLDGVTYRLKGRFDSAGVTTVVIPRKNGASLLLELQLSAGGEISGTLSDGTAVAEFSGGQSAGAKPSRTPHKGRWTVLLRAPVDALAEGSTPKGIGYGTIVVSNTGLARVRGALADGTPFTRGSAITMSGQWPVYVPLYKRKGVLAGLWQFAEGENKQGTVSGSARWSKPGGMAGQKFYREGFRLDLEVAGERYNNPQQPQSGAGFPKANQSGTVTLSGGNLSGDLSRTVTFLKAGKVIVSDVSPERLKLQINVAAGTFSGSFFDLTAKKSRKIAGVLLQTQAAAGGFFLGADESGSVTFKALE